MLGILQEAKNHAWIFPQPSWHWLSEHRLQEFDAEIKPIVDEKNELIKQAEDYLKIKNTTNLHLLLSERSRRERAILTSTQQSRILERECGAGKYQRYSSILSTVRTCLTYFLLLGSKTKGCSVAKSGRTKASRFTKFEK
jgi:hypothetical protein